MVRECEPVGVFAVGAGRQLFADFAQLLADQFASLSRIWGPNDIGAFLDH